MDLLPLPILITLIPIRDTTRAWGWRGARPDLRWVLGPAEPGATATGVTVISTLTTTIILTVTILTTLTVATSTRAISTAARRAAVSGNTIRNTGEMRRMVTEEPRTSLAVKVLAVRVELVIVPEVAPAHAQVGAELVLRVGEPETAQVVAEPVLQEGEPETAQVVAEP